MNAPLFLFIVVVVYDVHVLSICNRYLGRTDDHSSLGDSPEKFIARDIANIIKVEELESLEK
jgi:hypothetical protein